MISDKTKCGLGLALGLALAASAGHAAEPCFSIGAGAAFCPEEGWTFDRYVEDGVLHLAPGGNFYHLHKLGLVGEDGVDAEVIFEQHAASFAIEYGGEGFENVDSSQGERLGRRTLEYTFTVKDWDAGNRTRLTFLIDGDLGYSFVTSGRPPVDQEQLTARHEEALAAFRLNGAEN